jgi:hypothetical protein
MGSLGSATLQGSVYLPDGSAGVATVSTVALISLANLTDSYNLTAKYSGDMNYASSVSAAVPLTMAPAASAVVVSASPNSPVYGQPVTVQFTVSAASPSIAIPQGNSSLFLNGTVVSNQTLDATGSGSQVFNLLPGGANNFSLVYAGNGNVTRNTGSLTVTVKPATPSITVASSMNPSLAGQTVTITFNVTTTIPGGAPAGYISYEDQNSVGGIVVGDVVLDSSGTAKLAITPTTAGIYTIKGVYLDNDDNNFASASVSLSQTVRSPCDVNGDGAFTIVDVQGVINEALGAAQAVDDVNQDGRVNVADVQIVINAVLSLGCTL